MLSEHASEILNYHFRDEAILVEALTHASCADHRLNSNERLEFLGDAILGFLVCEYLYENFPNLLEGDLTKIKSTVVSRRVCARVSEQLDLCALLSLGKGMTTRPEIPSSVAAAVFESVIGAIYLDGGIDPARRFVMSYLPPIIEEAADSAHFRNFKSLLQQFAQKHLPINPSYVVLDEKGPDHAKAFEVCVELDDRRFASAWARSKKEAEQQAALHALEELELIRRAEDGTIEVVGPLAKSAIEIGNATDDPEADAVID